MEKKQNIWGFLATGYLYLAGMGAMMMTIIGTMVIMTILGNIPAISADEALVGSVAALVLTGLGACMLLLELTHKFRFPMVFLMPKSLMTIGAYALSVFMISTFLFAVAVFFSFSGNIQVLLAFIAIISGIVLAAYPGLELGEARGRGFWSGQGAVALFLVNAATCASGAIGLVAVYFSVFHGMFKYFFIGITILNLVLLVTYPIGAKLSGREDSIRGANLVFNGELRGMYIFGGIGVGCILPLVLLIALGDVAIAGACAIIGSALFRIAFMQAGVRLELPGEGSFPYSDSEIKALATTLENRWKEKAAITDPK